MTQTSKKVTEFCKKFKLQVYSNKNILITPNSTPQYFYFLEKGFVRNFIATKEGNELSINIFCAETLLPFTSLTPETILPFFFYETVNKAELRVVPYRELIEFIKMNNDIREEYIYLYISNINLLLSKTKEMIYHDTNYRIISALINLAKDLGCSDDDSIDFELNISHELIASFAGTTRETVTRKLSELKGKGFILKNYNSLKIVRLKELQNLITLHSL